MIDFIKIKLDRCNSLKLLETPTLDFKRTVSEKTGLLDTKAIADYHHCKILVFDSGMVLFSGSLHKMYNSITGIKAPKPNGNGFNGNQFYWHEIEFTLKHLFTLFEVSPDQMQIQQIEFGVNLTTQFNPQDFISGLLMHKGKPFEFRYNEFYSQAVHGDYIIKIYNKGNQYQMQLNTLRIEIKVLKMRYQKNIIGIQTVPDITPERLKNAFELLTGHLQDIIYYDNTIDKKQLSKVDKNRLQKFSNPNYWKKLPPNKRHTPKKLLADLIENNSDNFKGQLLMQIEKNGVRFHQLFENRNGVRFHTSIYRVNYYPSNPLKCPITGLSLEHEKKGAKYARTTTLNRLVKEDEKKYFEICSLLLSKTRFRQPKYEKTTISHLAKQIRNCFYNPNSIKRIGYKKKLIPQMTLF